MSLQESCSSTEMLTWEVSVGRAGERRRLPPPGNSLKSHQGSPICPCTCHNLKTSLCALISGSIFWKKNPTMVQTQIEGKKTGLEHHSLPPSVSLNLSNSKIVSSACSASSTSFPAGAAVGCVTCISLSKAPTRAGAGRCQQIPPDPKSPKSS